MDNLHFGKIPVSSGIIPCKQLACGHVYSSRIFIHSLFPLNHARTQFVNKKSGSYQQLWAIITHIGFLQAALQFDSNEFINEKYAYLLPCKEEKQARIKASTKRNITGISAPAH